MTYRDLFVFVDRYDDAKLVIVKVRTTGKLPSVGAVVRTDGTSWAGHLYQHPYQRALLSCPEITNPAEKGSG